MATTVENEKVEQILAEARKDVKRRYYVYERYKQRLQEVCESSSEYERAIFHLVRILEI